MARQLGLCGLHRLFKGQPVVVGSNAALCGQEIAKWRLDVVTDDVVGDDIDVVEDGLVEFAANLICRVQVELLDISQELHHGLDVGLTCQQVGGCRVELVLEFFAVPGNLTEPDADALLRESAVCGKVDEVIFLSLERLEVGGQLLTAQCFGFMLVVDTLGEHVPDAVDELFAELDGPVVRFERRFDVRDADIRGIARAVLDSAAEEVPVLFPVAIDGALLDEASVHSTLDTAVAAPERPFEVVRMDTVALARRGARLQNCLDFFEEVFVDDRLVATRQVLALILDLTEVVAVSEHRLEFAVGDGARGAALRGTRCETALSELVGDVLDGHLVLGEQLEGELNERSAFGVDLHRVDFAAFDVLGDVEVADRRTPEGAAVFRFLAHLVGDIGTVFTRAVLIEGSEDAVHELADRGRVDGLSCGD
nr:hypothetical protein [Microbacterium sorbitolivorans]